MAYVKSKFRQDWSQIKNLEFRRGGHVPSQGWRHPERNSRFLGYDPVADFDESLAFSCSDIGELASNVRGARRPFEETFPDNTLYFVYGFSSYVAVKRPCEFCKEGGIVDCQCELIVKALLFERRNLLSRPFLLFTPSVKCGPRNLFLKFFQNQVSNS